MASLLIGAIQEQRSASPLGRRMVHTGGVHLGYNDRSRLKAATRGGHVMNFLANTLLRRIAVDSGGSALPPIALRPFHATHIWVPNQSLQTSNPIAIGCWIKHRNSSKPFFGLPLSFGPGFAFQGSCRRGAVLRSPRCPLHHCRFFCGVSIVRRYLPIFSLLILVAVPYPIALGEQFTAHHRGREIVVHTNPLPVLLHRAVPPNLGRHVTLREYRSGRIPAPAAPTNPGVPLGLGVSRSANSRLAP